MRLRFLIPIWPRRSKAKSKARGSSIISHHEAKCLISPWPRLGLQQRRSDFNWAQTQISSTLRSQEISEIRPNGRISLFWRRYQNREGLDGGEGGIRTPGTAHDLPAEIVRASGSLFAWELPSALTENLFASASAQFGKSRCSEFRIIRTKRLAAWHGTSRVLCPPPEEGGHDASNKVQIARGRRS